MIVASPSLPGKTSVGPAQGKAERACRAGSCSPRFGRQPTGRCAEGRSTFRGRRNGLISVAPRKHGGRWSSYLRRPDPPHDQHGAAVRGRDGRQTEAVPLGCTSSRSAQGCGAGGGATIGMTGGRAPLEARKKSEFWADSTIRPTPVAVYVPTAGTVSRGRSSPAVANEPCDILLIARSEADLVSARIPRLWSDEKVTRVAQDHGAQALRDPSEVCSDATRDGRRFEPGGAALAGRGQPCRCPPQHPPAAKCKKHEAKLIFGRPPTIQES